MDYMDYVNIKQGTKSSQRFSRGNTLPLVQKPFGFASFAPQTNTDNGSWFYHADDRPLEGVRLTHQPSPWIGDHGAIVMLPQADEPFLRSYMRWSGFDTKNVVLKPHYMKYYLKRSCSTFELTPSMYGACVRVTFDRECGRYLSILPVGGMCRYEYVENEGVLYCYTDCNVGGGYDDGKLASYIVFRFDKGAVDAANTLVEDLSARIKKKGLVVEGENTGIHLALTESTTTFKVSASFISYAQALQNMDNDGTYSDFEELKDQNYHIWNEYLGRIDVKASDDVKRTFYSCMYRAFLFPHRAYEIDGDGNAVHFAPCDGSVKRGYRYTDNGFWDTYRTNYPFYSIVARDELAEMIEGFVQDYVDGGWLPRWTAGDAKNCMPSTAIDAVIADAASKGLLPRELMATAFMGMEKHANESSEKAAYGREGCEDYLRLGYIPYDKYKESVNLTLDAAYFDDCLATMAGLLGLQDKKDLYKKRSGNYRNIFDAETGYMRAKDSDGKFRPDFDPYSWGRDYTEASAWQTSMAVQHDLEGLAALHGGKRAFLRRLDELFEAPPVFRVGGYRREIHEMTEMADKDWGQCAVSNQPSFHIPFIYAYMGQPEKTHYWVERICREGFSADDDGFPGDEDNGSMAIWYVFACMGIYPICPGKPVFTVCEPLVDEVRIFGNRADFVKFGNVASYEQIMKQIL